MLSLSDRERSALLCLAIVGLLVPNGLFLYVAATAPHILRDALRNPIACVFIAEAFFLMFLIAWLLAKCGVRRAGVVAFVLLSLAGSLAFSVPATLSRLGARATDR